MSTNDDTTKVVPLEEIGILLNRDPQHIREFFEESECEIETVDEKLCINAEDLLAFLDNWIDTHAEEIETDED